MKVIIGKLGALGDVVRTLSILRPLKEQRGAKIDWLTTRLAAPLLENNPYVDRVFIVEEIDHIEAICEEEYDLGLSLEEEELPAKVISENSRTVIGVLAQGPKMTYTTNTSKWYDMSLISEKGREVADRLKKENKETYQDIWLRSVGLEKKNFEPTMPLTEYEKAFANSFIQKNGIEDKILVGFNTGAGSRWPMKSLSVEKTAELIDKASADLDIQAVLFGGRDEKKRNEKIIASCKHKPVDAGYGNSLREFSALIGMTDVLVSADTLALHIGIAVGRPVVGFFGPTSAAEIEIFGKGELIIPDSDCYCCYKKFYVPGGCIEKIDVGQLLEALKKQVRLVKENLRR